MKFCLINFVLFIDWFFIEQKEQNFSVQIVYLFNFWNLKIVFLEKKKKWKISFLRSTRSNKKNWIQLLPVYLSAKKRKKNLLQFRTFNLTSILKFINFFLQEKWWTFPSRKTPFRASKNGSKKIISNANASYEINKKRWNLMSHYFIQKK